MPVSGKLLAGPTSSLREHGRKERSAAFKAGAEAFQEGKNLSAFPLEYAPKMGDSVLFDNWRHGFLTASKAAHLNGGDKKVAVSLR